MTRTKWTAFAFTALMTALLGAPTAEAAKGRSRATRVSGKVNLNTASAKQLTLLPRVGQKAARAIVGYRAKHRFQSIREILKVRGIGKRTFLRLKAHLSVTGPNTLRKRKPKRKRRSRGRTRRTRRHRR